MSNNSFLTAYTTLSADASKRNMKGGNLEKNSREFLKELKNKFI